ASARNILQTVRFIGTPREGATSVDRSSRAAGRVAVVRSARSCSLYDAEMRTEPLGDSELAVSRVGLGCNNFGGRLNLERTREVVDAALDAGVTFFDTADVYGNSGGSERFLGELLQGRRDRVILATKFGMDMG